MTQNIIKDKNLYKNLGLKGAKLITELTRSQKRVFSFQEAVEALGGDILEAKNLLHNFIRKGWIRRIERGKYYLVPLEVDSSRAYVESSFSIASKLIKPYYLGFWTMLNYYGFTEQLSNTIFIASTKKKKPLSFSGVTYRFIRVTPQKMFGTTEIESNGIRIIASDREKTILDCLDHPEYCGGIVEPAKALWNARDEIDFGKLLKYAQISKNSAISKRLGFILELFGLGNKIDLNELEKMLKKGYSSLDPLLPRDGKYNTRWNLLVNIKTSELLSIRST